MTSFKWQLTGHWWQVTGIIDAALLAVLQCDNDGYRNNTAKRWFFYLMATKSTEGHGKMSFMAFILLCSSVDSVAIIFIFFRLKEYQGVPA